MKTRLLVVFHLYYHQQLDYYLGKMANICGCDWDLLVTVTEEREATLSKLKAFKSDVTVLKVENAGYDIWPFIAAIRTVDLSRYDFVMKLHTKNANLRINRINGLPLRKYMWRSLLVNSFLKSPESFSHALHRLQSNPSAGMICSRELYRKLTENSPEEVSLLRREMARLGIPMKDPHFCAGTMFIVRASLLGPFRDSDIEAECFSGQMSSHSFGSLAHTYERILSFAVSGAGHKIILQGSDRGCCILSTLNRGLSPLLENIFAITRLGEERRKYLIIFGMRFCLDSD